MVHSRWILRKSQFETMWASFCQFCACVCERGWQTITKSRYLYTYIYLTMCIYRKKSHGALQNITLYNYHWMKAIKLKFAKTHTLYMTWRIHILIKYQFPISYINRRKPLYIPDIYKTDIEQLYNFVCELKIIYFSNVAINVCNV